MKKHKTTLKDVATVAGVSPATVSRVLAGKSVISEETSAHVLKICQELNYVPNAAARSLTGQQSKMIGMIVPDISNPYFSDLFVAVERTAAQYGYHVLIANSMRNIGNELSAVESFIARRIDGVIISAISPSSQIEDEKLLKNIPCVYLGENHTANVSSVQADNERGAYEATKHLIDLGHRNIVFLGGRVSSQSRKLRANGYFRAMEEAGITSTSHIQMPDSALKFPGWTTETTMELLKYNHLDAIFSFNDLQALSVIEAAGKMGIKIPDDISVIGFDNISFSALPRVDLTTVSQRKKMQGETAVKRLMEKIGGNNEQTIDVLQPKLIVRGSTRAKNDKNI